MAVAEAVAIVTGAYDVLARIRAARDSPQPVGERCEMCSEQIADEHQHVVNVEGSWCVVGRTAGICRNTSHTRPVRVNSAAVAGSN